MIMMMMRRRRRMGGWMDSWIDAWMNRMIERRMIGLMCCWILMPRDELIDLDGWIVGLTAWWMTPY